MANAMPVADAYAALTVMPKPKLRYLEHWLFDTATQSPTNDNDGIVDAGETIDLAIVIRNHWGKADNVEVNLRAWNEISSQDDPYVTMAISTVNYGAIGSFSWDDNGLIYNAQGAITGVSNPLRFTVSPDTPNDHIIPFYLTITARNGLDQNDSSTYAFNDRFYLIVQRGQELPRIISENKTLSKEYFWIVPAATLIESGVTVTVTAGTQVQWGTPQPSDPYSDPSTPMIQVHGTLEIEGTFDEPVELFPSAILGGNAIIKNAGATTIKYAKIRDPQMGDVQLGQWQAINSVDHSYITGYSREFRFGSLNNSITHNLRVYENQTYSGWGGWYSQYLGNLDTSLIENPRFSYNLDWRGNVFLPAASNNNVIISDRGMMFTVNGGSPSNNAFLSRYWNLGISNWTRFTTASAGPVSLANNYWGTTDTKLIEAAIYDGNDSFLPILPYEPILTTPAETTYPFVWKVVLSTEGSPDINKVGPELVTFTVSFNRDMDITVQPTVSFGPAEPYTDYIIQKTGDGWINSRTWVGTFHITPVTGDGYQLIRVAGPARAADDPWLVIGDDVGRFRFEIITSGTEAMNLQATGGERNIDLAWTQNDFDLLAGFNLYKSTSATGTFGRLNTTIIAPDKRSFKDSNVQPGQPYYYKFTVVKSDMSESKFSNIATATPIDTIPPIITHTPITQASPGLSLTISADVTDNVAVKGVTLYYRAIGVTAYSGRSMTKTTGNTYYATIEGSLLTSPGIEYYISATDGISTVNFGRPEWPYQIIVVDKPVITAVSPNKGPASGGTSVTVAGSNFKAGATVTFGGASADNVTVVSSSQFTASTPAYFPTTVDIVVTNPDGQYGTLLRGFTYESEVASISLPSLTSGQNSIIQVPVNAANVNGLAALSFTVAFDPDILRARGARSGTLTPGWSVVANTGIAGQIRVAMATPGGTVSGSGVLAYLEFEVIGPPGSTIDLSFAGISLNDGAIPNETASGTFTVEMVYAIAGTVGYWKDGASVPGIQLTLYGDRVYAGQSDANGAYAVGNVPPGSYTLTPSKSGDISGISAYDAALALQHEVGLITLAGSEANAADVNKSGAITSMDAFWILQAAVGLITLPFPCAGLVWEFDPPTRTYSNVSSDLSGQDFTAILLGDVSGNWSGQGASQTLADERKLQGSLLADPIILGIKEDPLATDGTLTIKILVDPLAQKIFSFDLGLTYDAAWASLLSVNLGEALENWLMGANLEQTGEVSLALAGAWPMQTGGAILTLKFSLLETGQTARLQASRVSINERTAALTANSGDINGDISVDLTDALLAMKVLAGALLEGIRPDYAASGADVDGDNKIGLPEVMYILQRTAEIR